MTAKAANPDRRTKLKELRANLAEAEETLRAIRGGEIARTGRVSGELTFLRRDGSMFPGEISSLLFRDRLGAPRASMIIRDITERKRGEDLIKSQLAELQRWQSVMLGREERVLNLKQEVNNLLCRLGEPIRYPSQETTVESQS